MTVTTRTNKAQHLGNGATTAFPYPFRIFSAADLIVTRTVIATGADTRLALGTDYTVTGVGRFNGGDVVFPSAPSADVRITILRRLLITQETDLRNQGAYFAETHEDVFDRAVMIDQQQQEELDRVVRLHPADIPSDHTLPPASTRANKALVFDGEGNPSVSQDDYVNQTAATAANLALATEQAGIATAQAGIAAGNATLAINAQSATETAAALASSYIQQALGFTASTAYDFGSVADPFALFPTDFGGLT